MSNVLQLRPSLYRNLDIITSLMLFIGGIIITALSALVGFGQYGLGGAFLIAPTIYIISKFYNSRTASRYMVTKNQYKISTIAFILIIFFAILSLSFSSYSRPPVHFLLITTGFGLVLVDIQYVLVHKSHYARQLALIKIIVASLVYRTGRYFVGATIPGNDIHFHLSFASAIVKTGHLPSGAVEYSQYSTTAIFHLAVASLQVIGLSETMALYALVVLFGISTVALIYVTVCSVHIPTSGLFAAVFVSVGDMFILRGVTSITPSIFTILFVMLIFYLVTTKTEPRKQILIIGILIISIFTHQLSGLVAVLMFTIFSITKNLTENTELVDDNQDLLDSTSVVLVIAAGTTMLLQWMVSSRGGTSLLGAAVFRIQRVLGGIGSGSPTSYAASLSQHGAISNILYNLGYAILVALALYGALYWLQHDNRTPTKFGLIATSGALFVLIYPATIVGLDQFLIPHRILVFLLLILAIFAGVAGSVALQNSPRSRLAIIVVTLLIVFFSITAPFINRGSPLYDHDRVYRTELTDSEVNAILYATDNVRSETTYLDPLVLNRTVRSEQRQHSIAENSKLKTYPPNGKWTSNSLVVIREMFRYRGYQFGDRETFAGDSGARVLSSNPLQGCNRELIYESSDTQIFHLKSKCTPP